jgi:hypothetical protein
MNLSSKLENIRKKVINRGFYKIKAYSGETKFRVTILNKVIMKRQRISNLLLESKYFYTLKYSRPISHSTPAKLKK